MELRDTARLCQLLQLASPLLPVGAYSYSHGLEYAVSARWITNEKQAGEWITGLLRDAIGCVDLPIMARLFLAWDARDPVALNKWNAYLLGMRETKELALEDSQQGAALARLLKQLELDENRMALIKAEASYCVWFTLAASEWQLTLEQTLTGYAWSWCENQVANAMKLIPLGQSSGQRLLRECCSVIPQVVQQALTLDDESIGSFTPALAIASSLHETQYSRLYRS